MAYRSNSNELAEARRQVDRLVASIPVGEQRSFEQPWELRAFALAVAAHNTGLYEWEDFQRSLIASIQGSTSVGSVPAQADDQSDRQADRRPTGDVAQPLPEQSYYEHWLTALETVLAGSGALSEADIDERARAILAIPQNADHQVARPEPVTIDPAH